MIRYIRILHGIIDKISFIMADKCKINLIGGGFQHAYGSTLWKVPKYVEWCYESADNPISVYVDNGIQRILNDKNDGKLKFGWILESNFISSGAVEYTKRNVEQLRDVCTGIFTHHEELIRLDPTYFLWCPAYGTYIDDIRCYPKTKMISMISSSKSSTELHKLRCKILGKLAGIVDCYGRDTNPIDKKEEGLCDYMYSIAIENDSYGTYFTEKLLDCFATGTIPIYLGAPDIGNHFNSDGILPLTNDFDPSLYTRELYYERMPAILDNLERTKPLDILDDWVYNEYIKQYV